MGNSLGTEHSAEPEVIADITATEVGTGVAAGYPRVIVDVLLGKPFVVRIIGFI